MIVWSDESTRVDGALIARGGPLGGKGGFVETSGKIGLSVLNVPELGTGGEWLIDPRDVTIVASGGPTRITDTVSAQISVGTIHTALSGGATVVITTTPVPDDVAGNGDITWNSGADLNRDVTGNFVI